MDINSGADMLIATRAYVDKIEGFYNESFEDGEIELVLNKAQLRLLDDLISKNFQQGTLRYQWLKPFQKRFNAQVQWTGDKFRVGNMDWPTNMHYFISASGFVQIDPQPPEAYSEYGTQRRYLRDISEQGAQPGNGTQTELKNIDVQITGASLDKEQSMFYGNDYRNPRAEYTENGLRIYRDKSFIVKEVEVDYVEKPSPIDVSSTQSLEWTASANQVIVDYAVEYLRLSIQDPAYQGNVQDMNLRTQTALNYGTN